MGIVTILSVAIIGPIEEELTFRGLTIHILKRTDASFWVINVIQALLFGIMHLNLVQGSYAFIMGLVAGYLVMRYHSLWAGIAFHILFNSYSFVSSLLSGILRKIPNLLLLLIFLVVGTLLVVFSLRSISSGLRQREEATEKESC